MDAVMAMEGNGPRGGTPRQMNALLLSSDPIALDATMCRNDESGSGSGAHRQDGRAMGAGTYLADEIEVLGDNLDDFIAPDYKVDRGPVKTMKQSGGLQAIQNRLVPRPYIAEDKCVKCGVCVNMCPVRPKAVDWHDGDKSHPPNYRYDRCIRCYCCQELCPESAIHLRVPLLRRLLGTRDK
jgi:Pyruvate/2-oxoacid:ferredoxin oxidoreductase delta subunit